jgi:HlyD family secretion protein
MQTRPSPVPRPVSHPQADRPGSVQAEQLSLFPTPDSETQPQRRTLFSRWKGLAIVTIGLVGLGVGGWKLGVLGWKTSPGAIAQAQNRSGSQNRPPARPVEVTTLQNGNAQTEIQLLGQVEASQQSTLRAQTGGIIERLMVQTGDRVTEGMTLAVLDDSDQRLAVAQAQAQLAQQRSQLARLEEGTRPEIIAQRQAAVKTAQAREGAAQDQLDRIGDLVREGAFSQRQLVEAQAALDAARSQRLEAQAELAEAKAGPIQAEIAAQRANVKAATAALNQTQLVQRRTQILATSSGIVQTRQVSTGDLVQAGSAIVTLISGDQLDVLLEVPENLSGQVTAGTPVTLTSRALPKWQQNVAIAALIPSADAASRRQRVRVELRNPPQGLLAGMAIEAKLVKSNNRPSFVVSRDVLTQRQGKWMVFTIVNDQAKSVPVEMVTDMGMQVAIASSDLQTGETIVARGGDGLRDGMDVKVVGK